MPLQIYHFIILMKLNIFKFHFKTFFLVKIKVIFYDCQVKRKSKIYKSEKIFPKMISPLNIVESI